jgi:hypothetical protein
MIGPKYSPAPEIGHLNLVTFRLNYVSQDQRIDPCCSTSFQIAGEGMFLVRRSDIMNSMAHNLRKLVLTSSRGRSMFNLWSRFRQIFSSSNDKRRNLPMHETLNAEVLEQRALLSAVTVAVESDTFLTNFQNQEANLGGVEWVSLYKGDTAVYRPLVEADLSGLDAVGSAIENATLELYHFDGLFDNQELEVSVYAVTQAWEEGIGQSNFIPGDGATWLSADTGVAWNAAGSDFNTSYDFGNGANGIVAQVTIPAFSSANWIQVDVTSAVQAWQDGALENHGLVFIVESGEYSEHKFSSSEAVDVSLRPRINIEVTDVNNDDDHHHRRRHRHHHHHGRHHGRGHHDHGRGHGHGHHGHRQFGHQVRIVARQQAAAVHANENQNQDDNAQGDNDNRAIDSFFANWDGGFRLGRRFR